MNACVSVSEREGGRLEFFSDLVWMFEEGGGKKGGEGRSGCCVCQMSSNREENMDFFLGGLDWRFEYVFF